MTVRNGPAPFSALGPAYVFVRAKRELEMRRLVATICAACIAGILAHGTAIANTEKCERLYSALNEYDEAREAWSNASSDAFSIELKNDKHTPPLVLELAQRREAIKEERAIQALVNLREALSMMDAAKDWNIPDYEGVGNFRHMQFYIIAADVACS